MFSALPITPVRAQANLDPCNGSYTEISYPGAPLQTVYGADNSLAPTGSNSGKSLSVSCNKVTLTGGPISGSVEAAFNGLDTDAIEKNVLIIDGGTANNHVQGGLNAMDGGTVKNNVLIIKNSSRINPNATGGSSDSSGASLVTRNTVIIMDSVVGDFLMGGWAKRGNVTENDVTIINSTVEKVCGGRTNNGNATGNSVTIKSGTISSYVYGGWSVGGGVATNNTVTIEGGTFGGSAQIYGGSASGSYDAFTDNTLNLSSSTSLPDVGNFQTINFGDIGTANVGTLNVTPTGAAGGLVSFNTGNHDILFKGQITNSGIDGGFEKVGTGTLTLDNAASSFKGQTLVRQGTLRLEGAALGSSSVTTDTVNVSPGATLEGYGAINGATTLDSGAHLTPFGGVLAIDTGGAPSSDGLTLASGSAVNLSDNGQLNVNQTIQDNGATWSVLLDAPGFYVLASYANALGTLFGTTNPTTIPVYLSGSLISHFSLYEELSTQTNLLLSALPDGVIAEFWNGDSGNWSDTSWSEKYASPIYTNAPWEPNDGHAYAVFGTERPKSSRTVSVDSHIPLYGISFLEDGYVLDGPGSLTLQPSQGGDAPVINVGAGDTATLAVPLAGTDPWQKVGGGTLVLDGANTSTGMMDVKGGTLEIGANGSLTSTRLALHDEARFVDNATTPLPPLTQLDVYGHAHYTPSGTGQLDISGGTMNFYVPSTMHSGATLLEIHGDANISGAQVDVRIDGSASPLKPGDHLVLALADGTINGEPANENCGEIRQGIMLQSRVRCRKDNQSLLAEILETFIASSSKAYSEAFLSALALLNRGGDLAAGTGIRNALHEAKKARLVAFTAGEAEKQRIDSGSHVNMESTSMLAGLAKGQEIATGDHLTAGLFLEMGRGRYDTHNGPARGDGRARYQGAGLLARIDSEKEESESTYAQAIVRAGRVHNDFGKLDVEETRLPGYKLASDYSSLHLGAGYRSEIGEHSLDLYGNYTWTHQQGGTVVVAGDRLKFENADSSRVRIGGRWNFQNKETITPYIGVAYEHEFKGTARAREVQKNLPLEAPSLRGGTGIVEAGVTIRPTERHPLSLNLGVQAFAGQRKGVAGGFSLKYEF